ncbi:M90 family metallopeptidase [Mucilaginibacter ginsenosidivorans]|uniref:Zinc-dependent peptidase n=1 Tax=Mucilaginibacter ginsenosidivorans TaxID=398053 RepID=A0A5B8UT15_9SPHI|nr:M90 family metallopeptidase [Mucilaginibacter ginsenosidivorans]QEC61855.1 zinc-dependent peptidase [Mucilaginibacter ginsenosidivorans]
MYILFAFLLIILIGFFLLRKKKNEIESDETNIETYRSLLNDRVDYYQKLNEQEKLRFEKCVLDFLQYVNIEGVGTTITDSDRVLIASSAIITVFGFGDWKYKNLTNVILYPDTFDNDFSFEGENRNILGMVGSGFMNGQMLLARAALEKGFSSLSGKGNTAIHEFVHLLDKSDGATDGIIENLITREYVIPWLKMMHKEMHRIQTGKSDINPYALTSEAEFLAVAAEYFFEKPEQLKHKHPEIYEQLCNLFRQDPA